jgi:cytochrome c oxidase subunit 1/cytochrome c oxidase subunit I+III
MLVTTGAFVLGIGILMSIVNLFISMRSGQLAGRNPWNADGLEWETDSPPKPYATVHLPTVVSRHPLWDGHDEEFDPDNDRILDQERLTLTTTWLDAELCSVATIPKDTLIPLMVAVVMFALFCGLVFQVLWLALVSFVVTFVLGCYWLWPRPAESA